MSLLHQESSEEIDDAALGEEFTKGTSHVVWASILAAVVVTLSVVVLILATHKPPAATGEILQVWAFPRHGQTSGVDANGEAKPQENFDQVLLFAHLRVKNQSSEPLLMQDILANVKPADGIPLSVSAGSAAQFEEAFLAYPDMEAAHGKALSPHTTIQPGEKLEGTVLWVFQMNKQQLDARSNWEPNPDHNDPGSAFGLNFTVSLQYHPNLVLAPRHQATEQ